MKVETPQISWHGIESDKGRNAPLLSCSVIESGLSSALLSSNSKNHYGQVLATAGNDSAIHLWKLEFSSEKSTTKRIHVVDQQLESTNNSNNNGSTSITHLLALRRHERSVNAIKFSPDGLVLASVGDGGSIVLWSIPVDKRGNDNGKHFWSLLEKESDLDCKVVVGVEDGPTEDIIDIAWVGSTSKSLVVSCIDHNAFVLETNNNYSSNNSNNKWKCIAKLKDHTHYVQGVAYDPLGVYLTTQGSDRTVRVYSKKTQNNNNNNKNNNNKEPYVKEAMIKYWPSSSSSSSSEQEDTKKEHKRYMYADETMVESFFRRLSWTIDGAFLITPAAIWNEQYATLLFARHQFDQPVAILSGQTKPTVVVRPCPVLFTLPKADISNSSATTLKSNLPYRSVFAVLTLDSVLLYDTFHLTPLAMARGLHYASLTDCAWTCDGRTLIIASRDGYISLLSFDKGELGEVYTPPPSSTATTATTITTTTTTSLITSKEEEEEKEKDNDVVKQQQPSSITESTISPAELSSHFIAVSAAAAAALETSHHYNQSKEEKSHGKKRVTPILVSSHPSGDSEKKIIKSTNTTTTTIVTVVPTVTANVNKLDASEPSKAKKRIQPTLMTS